MNKGRFSVDFILRAAVRKLLSFGVAAILIMFLSQFYVLSLQSHKAACEIVSARLNQFIGPLSRELAVGEIAVASSMFDDFRKVVAIPGSTPNLEMNLSVEEEARGDDAICKASMWGTEVFAPISFAGRRVAVIQGSVTYFPTLPLLGFAVLVIAGLMWGVRLWAIKLLGQIQSLVIEPVKELSSGQKISNTEPLPYEVEDVSSNIESLRARLVEEEKNSAELAREKQMSEMAVQVAHDIRSPLSVLTMLEREDFNFDNQTRALMAQAAKRIHDITQSLTKKYRKENIKQISRSKDVALPLVVLDAILSEKRSFAEDQKIHLSSAIEPDAKTAFVNIESVELGRVISNLLDNALESFDGVSTLGKTIVVTGRVQNGIFELNISDTGKGIAPEVLPTLAKKGVTLKASGNGLGLFHARQVCENAGGQFELRSELGRGTSVILTIPVANAPGWFAVRAELVEGTKIVALDDDETIHGFWKMTLRGRDFESIYSTNDLRLKAFAKKENYFFFVDYQLGAGQQNGLQLIRDLQIADRAILVTSRFNDPAIQEAATSLGIKIVPKQILTEFQINWQLNQAAPSPKCEFVLIDNDHLVRDVWELVAKSEGKRILIFEDVESFLNARVPYDTTIFLDEQLGHDKFGNEVCGTEKAIDLWKMGYRKIHLATGVPSSEGVPPWIKSVRGKSYPTLAELR